MTPFTKGSDKLSDRDLYIDLIDNSLDNHNQVMHARNNSSFALQRAQASPDGIAAASEIFDRILNDNRANADLEKSFD